MADGWKFNNITGTMEPISSSVPDETPPKYNKAVVGGVGVLGAEQLDGDNTRSIFTKEPVPKNDSVVNENIVQFRERSDLTIMQIIDEENREVMGYISGYALDIKFNLEELNSVEKIEQFINGLGNVFRKIIIDSALGNENNE